MFNPGPGEIAALLTALSWTATMMAFEAAGRRVGSLNVNFLRVVIASVFLAVFGYLQRGLWLPFDASPHNWIWLSVSGLIGLTLGDICLFRAFILVGARIAALVMAFVPVISALISWLFLGEILSRLDQTGMLLTTSGIIMVVTGKRADSDGTRRGYSLMGLLMALGGALGQAVGLVFSKYGMGAYDAFAANHIRLLAALAGFVLLFTLTGRWRKLAHATRHPSGMAYTTLGSFFGPFVGVSLSLYAVQHTQVGIAATIIALVPIFIIPPSMILKKEKIGLRDLVGAILAVGGSALLFI
ncbi:MAG: DMT family transporter [Desulfobacterales bacterium]|nr:DMT family transporter [Desulfobacterales bacterium]